MPHRPSPSWFSQATRRLPSWAKAAGLAICLTGSGLAWADPAAHHAYALWGEPRYPADFSHFDYANPDAPKGGQLRLVSNLRYSTFDKYNPFTMRGSAPAYLESLLFETLLMGSLDETATGYGLLAESVEVAPDGLSATFRLRPEARFHNGQPVLAEDVRHSYETLISPKAMPAYASVLADVERATVLDERTIRFHFRQPNRELPLLVGSLPVFSRDWGGVDGQSKPFDEIVTDIPIGSGPYRIGPVVFGRDITYVRDPDYWGAHLNVNRGSHNFDRIHIPIYQDNTAKLEALKAGEFDVMQFYSAGDWARRVQGRRFDHGELVKAEFEHRNPTGFQSYLLNVRKPFLQDVRVRQALSLAMDYEWMNQRLFYNAYRRVHGIFGNTACQAQDAPSEQELTLLEPWRNTVQPAVFAPIQPPPRTDGPHNLRDNLRQARVLLAEAGWQVHNGQLRNAQGQRMVLEYLTSGEAGIRTVSPWMRNLEKLGIELRFRSVDYALYLQRMRTFDFDITTLNLQGTHNPGQEYAQLFGSEAANQPDSSNYTGIQNPAVDALIEHMVQANTLDDFTAACRSLERVIVSEQILIPQWYANTYRVAYNTQRLRHQSPMPPYTPAGRHLENWVMSYWWSADTAPTASTEPTAP